MNLMWECSRMDDCSAGFFVKKNELFEIGVFAFDIKKRSSYDQRKEIFPKIL